MMLYCFATRRAGCCEKEVKERGLPGGGGKEKGDWMSPFDSEGEERKMACFKLYSRGEIETEGARRA